MKEGNVADVESPGLWSTYLNLADQVLSLRPAVEEQTIQPPFFVRELEGTSPHGSVSVDRDAGEMVLGLGHNSEKTEGNAWGVLGATFKIDDDDVTSVYVQTAPWGSHTGWGTAKSNSALSHAHVGLWIVSYPRLPDGHIGPPPTSWMAGGEEVLPRRNVERQIGRIWMNDDQITDTGGEALPLFFHLAELDRQREYHIMIYGRAYTRAEGKKLFGSRGSWLRTTTTIRVPNIKLSWLR